MIDVVALTADLLAIDSPTGGEAKIVDHLSRFLVAHDWNVTVQEVTPGRGNIWASHGGGGVTLSTHLDTVRPYFGPRLDDGKLYGRGACDAKGIAAAMIAAAQSLAEDSERRVDLLLVIGEEGGSDGARAANQLPATSRYLINGEPTQSQLATGAKGSLRVTLRTRGRESHSAYPHLGRSAIEPMLELLPTVKQLQLPRDERLGEPTVNIGVIRGGTEANVIPGECEAQLMFRIVSPVEPVKRRIEEWVEGRAEITYGSHIPAQLFHTIPGFETAPVAYTTDIPLLDRWGTPLLFGPGSIHVAHTPEEHIVVNELRAAVGIVRAHGALAALAMTAAAFRSSERLPVAVLGATGAVGQTFVRLLADHPWFRLAEVAASERSVGRRYGEVVHWLEGRLSAETAALEVVPCDPATVRSRVVFSALDAAAANTVEPAFARAGGFVFSNTKNFRMEPDVPLVIAEVNASHLDVLETQRKARGWSGAIVTNANCAAIAAALPLAPLHQAFGLRQVFVVTMQAVSGAGYPGVASLDILGNVIPFISEEDAKIERELPKMLGRMVDGAIEPANFVVSAQANRVPVEHGHTVCLSVGLETRASAEQCRAVLEQWSGDECARGLPSSPERVLLVTSEADRPQPRRDVHTGRGMTVVIGRVRPDPLLDVRFVALSHNTIRGAAGASLLNAEVMAARAALPR